MLNELLTKRKETGQALQNKLEQLKKQEETIKQRKEVIRCKIYKNSMFNTVYRPLAKAICERLNIKYFELYGPFGLNQETSIYFSNHSRKESRSRKLGIEASIDITHVKTYSLLDLETREDGIYYWDGVTKVNDYEKGSIGYYNGLNKVKKPLPNDLEDIIKVLVLNKKEHI